jgi:hypothetical protein
MAPASRAHAAYDDMAGVYLYHVCPNRRYGLLYRVARPLSDFYYRNDGGHADDDS